MARRDVRRRSRRPVPSAPSGIVGRTLRVRGRLAHIVWEAGDQVGWAYSPDDYVHVVPRTLVPELLAAVN